MITALSAEGFKCFNGQRLRLTGLTLLTGVNGSGKSTVIQTILLARTAALVSREIHPVVPLNGPFNLMLGQALDVTTYSQMGSGSEITVSIENDGVPTHLCLIAHSNTDRYLDLHRWDARLAALSGERLGDFTYLSADREGPRDFQTLQSVPGQVLELGTRGEFVSEVLQAYERQRVQDPLQHPTAKGMRFAKQAEAWLGEFARGIEVRVESTPNISVVALRFKYPGASTEWLRPANLGFGITHCFPVIIAALLAKPRSILIVDSPEAHLHPAAQSLMGSFLARVAAAGVQVLVETHSDHVLSGIRLAIVDSTHPISRDDVTIYHLSMTERGFSAEVITVDDRGSLSMHPKDFFDQAEKDIAGIIRKRRPLS